MTATRIDAHLHLWDRSLSPYRWIPPGELDRDFLPVDVVEDLARAGIDSAILVQADDSESDTAYLLNVARTSPWAVGVVGWLPLDDPVRASRFLERWSAHPEFCGVRQLIHDDPRDDLLDDPSVLDTLQLISAAGLAFDVPDAWPRHLAAVGALADSVPELTIVIDHLAKPPTSEGRFAEWEATLRAVAARPTIIAKVSGLQVAGIPYSAEAVRRAWEVALDAFGPSRLAYGSDWPMALSHGGYSKTWQVFSELIAELSPSEQAQLLSGTARRAYRLDTEAGNGT